ncbi:MAG: sigma-70 family RNA polymerase sigma factor [Oscillospiraceae bacterium]|nr:sigma-70 family RNA polymerase sigma factor [Oscillospiraceae bacterium]
MVYRLAFSQMKNKSDADDVYQQVFFKYVEHKPIFKSKEHQKAWFIRVTLNCSKSLYSSVWKKRIVPLDDSIPYTYEEQNCLMHELQKLPQKYLAVIHLFYYEEMSSEEIKNVLGISLSAVKMRLSRARDMLKTFMKEEDYV